MQRIHDVASGAVRDLLRGAPLSEGKVGFAWRLAVGPALERATAVALDGHALLVYVETRQWAREVHRSTPVILRRLEHYLGAGVISALEVRLGHKPGA